MGWSCSAEASRVMEVWTEACVASTESQNTWKDTNGSSYFWEASRKEHADGAVTGSVWKMVGENSAIPSGTFRIEGDGLITRAPKFLKNAWVNRDQRKYP